MSSVPTTNHPTTTIVPTSTVSSPTASEMPNPAVLNCGLHGLAVGDYYLAGYVLEREGVPVTLQDCYQACSTDTGCESFEFYPEPITDAPRCALYGGSEADSLGSVNPDVPNVWYDFSYTI
ncbi:hypothetical protein G7Y89_g8938 [Cudoniella acicularis]|uniref:Apple domain-containing protein n=1 Tax=Cudoniella acicularis TaxID=354080 RepID=A0A8H4RH75_9HELO|nr:hypothetical protein G7Y89_g8938 [Cudoniella acicularis]